MADSRNWFGRRSGSSSKQQPTQTIIPQRHNMNAAGGPIMSPASPDAMQHRSLGWQRRVLELADLVPEPAGAGGLVRNSVDRVGLVVESKSSTKTDVRIVQEYIDKLDRGRAAQLIWITGEVYITIPPLESGRDPQVLSISEFKPARTANETAQVIGPSGWENLKDPWFRLWKPALSNRLHATSPHKAALDLLEAMYVHQLADSAGKSVV